MNPRGLLRFVRNAAVRARRSLGRYSSSHDDIAELRTRLALYERDWAPGHFFYSPIPSLAEISHNEASIFAEPQPSLPGIDLRERAQLELLDELGPF